MPQSRRFTRRVFRADTAYHLASRRFGKKLLFHDADDYRRFLSILARLVAKEPSYDHWGNLIKPVAGIRVLAYCLMPTHFHLVVHQDADPMAIAALMRRLKQSYSRYYRRRYKLAGRLYDSRYRSVLIDEPSQLAAAIAYVHANPVDRALAHEWSSHRLFMSARQQRDAHWCDAEAGMATFAGKGAYLQRLHQAIDDKRSARQAA